MSIPIIDQLRPLGNFPAVDASDVQVGNERLSTVLSDTPSKNYVDNALSGKVDKETGKGLSANDYTTLEKTKLSSIEANANNYVHPTTSGNRHIPSGGSSGKILGWSADGTAAWVDPESSEYSDATPTSHGLMSVADKIKLDGISAGAEKMFDIDISKLANFDPDDISVALNSIVPTLTQGKRVYLPYGEYNVRNPIILHAPDFCTFHLLGLIHSYVSGNCFSIGGSCCEFVFDDLRSTNIGTAILVDKNFSYSRLRFRYIGNFANGLVFKMSAGDVDFVQYSKINFEFISNIVNKCIWIDGTTHDGWVNENTFVGGRLKGGYGIYIEGGTTEQGVGFDGNKFYNIGFEGIDNDGVYINGETYANVFLHCRAMEHIGTHLINEVSQKLGHNQYYFDCVVPNDKIVINGSWSKYHGTIANQYTQWIAGGKDVDGLLPHDERNVIRYTDIDKTETIGANENARKQYGIPGVERYEPIMVFVKTQSTQDGFDYRSITANITNFDVDNGLFDVVYNSTRGYAIELHMTYRIIYRWVG